MAHFIFIIAMSIISVGQAKWTPPCSAAASRVMVARVIILIIIIAMSIIIAGQTRWTPPCCAAASRVMVACTIIVFLPATSPPISIVVIQDILRCQPGRPKQRLTASASISNVAGEGIFVYKISPAVTSVMVARASICFLLTMPVSVFVIKNLSR